MLSGYCIMVKDYKAEVVEFTTLTVITMPDQSKLHLIHTKYGDDYFSERELRQSREQLDKECAELNEALAKAQGGGSLGTEKGIYKPR